MQVGLQQPFCKQSDIDLLFYSIFADIICPWSSLWSTIMEFTVEWILKHGKKWQKWEI